MIPRSDPPLGSIPIAVRGKSRNRAINAVQPAALFRPRSHSMGQHHHVQTILRHVDSTKALNHLRVPSLLMRARALATVREWKKRPEHQAHSRSVNRGGYGLPVATGAVS